MSVKDQSISEIEAEALAFWEEKKIFLRSVEREAKNGDFVFYDGPPFATGTPHYGHLVGGIIKDVIPRFATMNNYRVERKWGWDCHGLPIENIVEKELGTKTKKEIEALGVEKFNNLCRTKVDTYIEEWKKVVSRLGRFVDMESSYRTMDLNFMESVWWAFKTLWDKGLIYKDHRSMHVCPRCETTLSQSEVSEGYKDIKDLSVTAKFKLKTGQKIKTAEGEIEVDNKTFVLAWTTTPWTLIGNVALAVASKEKQIKYLILEAEGDSNPGDTIKMRDKERMIFAYDKSHITLSNVLGQNFKYEYKTKELPLSDEDLSKIPNYYITEKGSRFKTLFLIDSENLFDLEYEPLYDYYAKDEKLVNRENGWKIYSADFVTTNEGAGIVHIAPAFGEDDMRLGKEKSLPFVQHVGMDGIFKEEVKDFPGLHVKPIEDHTTTDIEIIKNLAGRGLLFDKKKYEHSYPHCWRCDTPLINYATSSWFVNVSKLKPELLESAKKINWSPDYLKEGRFGNWLEGARDWSISRQRFWASCIPIWECACGSRKVIGSVSELEELTGVKINDIHKDKIDGLSFACPDCGGKMERIPDVLDCWFESGAMPYAQLHYPFENKEKLENNFPADFIAEGVDQTRTWFYYLHVLAGGLMGREGFQSVIANGIVLAEDGKKMSKKLKNYPNPLELMDKYGADALRAYLLSSPVVMAENLNFSENGVQESLRKNVMLLLNVYKFYQMFAPESSEDLEKLEKEANSSLEKGAKNILDIWVKAKLKILISELSASLDSKNEANKSGEINLPKAMRLITEFIDEFSTWYLRRSRDRFKADDVSDKNQAILTTRTVFLDLAKVIAPFMPFVAEYLWQNSSLNNYEGENSVHLETWPELEKLNEEEKVNLEKMNLVREIVSFGLAERDKAGIKIRQMLGESKVMIKKEDENENLDENYLLLITDELNITKLEIILADEGVLGENEKIKVELDLEITAELKQEGIKRELVRSINMMRKDLGLGREQKAEVYFSLDDEDISKTLELFKEEIKKETISSKIELKSDLAEFEATDSGATLKDLKVNGIAVKLAIKS